MHSRNASIDQKSVDNDLKNRASRDLVDRINEYDQTMLRNEQEISELKDTIDRLLEKNQKMEKTVCIRFIFILFVSFFYFFL